MAGRGWRNAVESQLKVLVSGRPSGTVVALAGEGGPAAAELRQGLIPEARARRVVIDLSALRSMAPASARVLLDLQSMLLAHGGTMAVACPQPLVAETLLRTGTNERIPVYDSVARAVAGRYGRRMPADGRKKICRGTRFFWRI